MQCFPYRDRTIHVLADGHTSIAATAVVGFGEVAVSYTEPAVNTNTAASVMVDSFGACYLLPELSPDRITCFPRAFQGLRSAVPVSAFQVPLPFTSATLLPCRDAALGPSGLASTSFFAFCQRSVQPSSNDKTVSEDSLQFVFVRELPGCEHRHCLPEARARAAHALSPLYTIGDSCNCHPASRGSRGRVTIHEITNSA